MAMYAGHWHLRGYGIWALEDKATQTFVGQAGLWFPEGWSEPEIHWLVFPEWQRRGLATEAALHVRTHAAEMLGMSRLVSCIEPANLASVRVAERVGAVRERSCTIPGRTFDVYRHLTTP